MFVQQEEEGDFRAHSVRNEFHLMAGFSAQMSAQEWISGHQTLSLMLSDSCAVLDPDYPEHPTVGWGVIRWERIPAIYSSAIVPRSISVDEATAQPDLSP